MIYACVLTATGSGKSFCYQLPVIADVKAIILILCPLNNLMWNQVQEAKRLGISACAINAATLSSDPQLLSDVSRGKYQLVFSSMRIYER